MSKNGYKAHKKWRKTHPKTRNEGKKRHYAKSRVGARNKNARWNLQDETLILAEDRPIDAKLAVTLGRSVQAIQVKRTKLLLAS